MPALHLPKDLATFLRSNARLTLYAAHYETVALVPRTQLRVETLEVTPNRAPFRSANPNWEKCGYYAVPAVNLVQGDPSGVASFPAWLFLWLPNERRYGSFDSDHGDLIVYGTGVRWSDILADPTPFVNASDGQQDGPVAVEFLQPWPKYPFVETVDG